MANFPKLSSGSVMQYPAVMVTSQPSQVIRFVDGHDQRYLTRAGASRRWLIRLEMLTDVESAAFAQFFEQQASNYVTFSFPDPFTGSLVPNCRFDSEMLSREFSEVDSSASSIWVIETNG